MHTGIIIICAWSFLCMSTLNRIVNGCEAVSTQLYSKEPEELCVQDMATPHLVCNCGKRIFSVHGTLYASLLYVCLCMHMLYACDHVSSRLVLMI